MKIEVSNLIPVIKHRCYWKKLRIQWLGFSG